MKTMIIKSYAKINISLKVVSKREDGFHDLDMIMVPIALHDSMLMTELKKGVDHYVTMDDYSIINFEDNVATKAILAFDEKYDIKKKIKLDIHKVIPSKAGLGGGSSNAAFTLTGLNTYCGVNAPQEELIKLSEKLGSDVPFFVACKPCRCKGTGNIFEPIEIKNDYYVLIVKPEKGCKTAEVYNNFDSMNIQSGNIDDIVRALKEGNDEDLAKLVFNDLEAPAIKYLPDIQEVKDKLKNLGLKIVLMSGSGSTVFALSTNKKELKKAAKIIEKENKYKVIFTKIIK